MSDCQNEEMRDLLPDLIHARGSAAMRDRVRDHLARCDACTAELALLEALRAMATTPALDLRRIAGAVPAYSSRWRLIRSPLVRLAAAMVLVAGAAALWGTRSEMPTPDTMVAMAPASAAATPELAFGEGLADLNDQDLHELLDELETIEAVTSSETETVVLPGIGQGGA